MPVLETKGALSAQGYGLTTTLPQRVFIEDVFSTWLYTGNGGTQGIGNGIQLGAGATSPGWIASLGGLGTAIGYSVAVDLSGNVYVCGYSDAGGNDIQIAKYNTSGVIQWQRSLGGSNSQVGYSVAVDSSGNVYVCGSSNVSGTNDIQIAKYNTSGVIQWQRSLGGSGDDVGYSIAVDSSGNVYVCGSSNASGTQNFQIAKYNTSGNIQWQRSLGSASFSEIGYSITVDLSSNVYVCGFATTSTFAVIQIAKYDTNGVIQWQRRLGGSADALGESVAVDSSGNVYVCGSFNNAGNYDIQIAKYDTSGVIQWQRSLGSSVGQQGYSIAVDSSGNVYVCGETGINPSAIQIAKYNTSGVIQWQRNISSLGSNYGRSIAVDSSNNFYVCGYSTVGTNNFFIAKLPGDGSGQGAYTLGSNTYNYLQSSLVDTASSLTSAASSLIDAVSTRTDAVSSLTDAATSLTSTTTALTEGPGKGGLVWLKGRSGATDNALYDTARGATFDLSSNLTSAQTTQSAGLTGFLANGFSIGSLAKINTSAATYVSWTFREQPRFFDIVTYTGNGANRTIAHNLQSVPGCIIVKRTDAVTSWQVYHRSVGNTQYMVLNSTALPVTDATLWNNTTPTATEFSLGTSSAVNASGGTYVAYLFAHDAGGFGNSGGDNVISCGSYTGNGSVTGPTVTLGYEPQWLLVKSATGTAQSWYLIDNMRGFTAAPSNNLSLRPNTNNSEGTNVDINPTATGFSISGTSLIINASGQNYIYIAIRRGPMRTPTTGTSVFQPFAVTPPQNSIQNINFPSDLTFCRFRASTGNGFWFEDRLRAYANTNTYPSTNKRLESINANAETDFTYPMVYNVWNSSYRYGDGIATVPDIFYNLLRAPGFFDVVCYTGTGANPQTVSHNLTVAPELIIAKKRSATGDWGVYAAGQADGALLNTNDGFTISNRFTAVNATSFGARLGGTPSLSDSGATYVVYLFASCPGVSKVGSYTGNGSTQTINCGFSSGARFVLIKRTNGTGDWYVWDSARGIVAGNDPYLLLNSTAAEVTNTDWVDTAASGFELSNTAGNLVNTNGGSYIFLAIA